MTALVITGAPGSIVKYSGTRNDPRRIDDAGGTPPRQKSLHLLLDVSDERFRPALDVVFPGVSMMAKAMAANERCPAAVIAMAKKLDDVSVVVQAVDGSEVFTGNVCRVAGKPTLRIGPGAKKIEMPIVVKATMNRDVVRRVDDALGADAIVNVQTAQADIEDDVPATAQAPAATSKKGSKAAAKNGKVTVVLGGGDAAA